MTHPARLVGRFLRYRRQLLRGEAAGEQSYVWSGWQPPEPWRVEVRLPLAAATPEDAAAWCRHQTLRELQAVGLDRDGRVGWRVDRNGPRDPAEQVSAPWFHAPGELADLDPAHLESCLLTLAAEAVDAVGLEPELVSSSAAPAPEVTTEAAIGAGWRSFTLYRDAAYVYDPTLDTVVPRGRDVLVKLVGAQGATTVPRDPSCWHRRRRGPYVSSTLLPSLLEVSVRDAALLRREPPPSTRPAVLVLTSFLARGGAEHTLYETLRVLADSFDLAIATLAPHRPELGDRRADFRRLTPRLYGLGDLVHPAAMPGILGSLLDALGADTLYNANGTTLFYDFAPRLKAERPALRIVDHLYDHRVGYVERYADRQLLTAIDACVAENRRIAEVLVEERGWPAERVPVIWPCGRSAADFPAGDQVTAVRRRLRRELDLDDDDVVFLTAARMHPQKRPGDLVALAQRVRDLPHVVFLIAGGGEIEGEVDAAIAATAGARIRRLPFRTDIPELIVAADVGCLVSEYEGLPVFLLECLQAGRPFLGTEVGEMGYLLRATGAGRVVERPGDLDALERQVRRLSDPAVRRELAARAREAGGAFDVETCAARYGAVWKGEPIDDPVAAVRIRTDSVRAAP